MDRVLIIGVDSIAGRSVAQQLAARFDVRGVWFDSPEFPDGCKTSRIERTSLEEQCRDTDIVIFCGGAARSSWRTDFGDFNAEEQWLEDCVAAAQTGHARFVFLSSDAVFGGPWVFHDDDSDAYAKTPVSACLLQFEAVVSKLPEFLVVRTNIVGTGAAGRGFVDRILARLQADECEQVDANIHSTPVADTDFAELLTECLTSATTGVVNIGGSERTTQFRFANMLAGSLGYGVEHLIPADGDEKPGEQSLRCQRLRDELKLSTPMLKDTVQRVAESLFDRIEQPVAA